jgi:hypothetical protein
MWIALLMWDFSGIDSPVTNEFADRSRIIEDQINRRIALRKAKIKGVKKIAITLTDESMIDYIGGPIKGFSPVVNIRKSYNFNLFATLDSTTRNEAILNLIRLCINEATKKFSWEIHWFEEIVDEIRASGFRSQYIEGKIKESKSKEYKAGVEVDMQLGCAVISIVFYSRENIVVRRAELIKVHPNRLFISPLIGDTKWLSDKEFEVVNKEREIHFKASVENGAVEVYFTPKSKNTNQLIDDLLISSITTSKEQIINLLEDKIGRLGN